ncbi:MAG: Jag N-terminal domain-containing protein [Endomicrobium sp.]|jgi:spoIIIJ-associated protein|nr:Jag N-terminal domain-containing protein [Endomicrobium sp.]
MLEVEFKAKTVTEAIKKGLSQLSRCGRDHVKIKIVSEGSKGLFGLNGIKPAIVLMSIDNK